VDLESAISGDMFSVARVALMAQRALDNAASRSERNEIPATSTIPVREALRWATVEGARMLGLGHRIGSLEPGKAADLVILNATDLNLWPMHDPVSTVVMQAGLANVEAVTVAGLWKKRNGQLSFADRVGKMAALAASGRRIIDDMSKISKAA
jgi:cytosine/adenosine deaminase-related metal-dependent hydrolase